MPNEVYIAHMGHPTDPSNYGTACGAPWPETPTPDLIIPGVRVDPPAHFQPDQIVQCEACRQVMRDVTGR